MATQTPSCTHFPVAYDSAHNRGKIISCEEIDNIDRVVLEALGFEKRPKNDSSLSPSEFRKRINDLYSRMKEDFKFNCYRLVINSNDIPVGSKPAGFLYLGIPAIDETPVDELNYTSLYKCRFKKCRNDKTKSSDYQLAITEPIRKYNDTAELLKGLLAPFHYYLWTDKYVEVSKPRILDSKEVMFHMLNGILPRSNNEQVPKRGCPGGSVYT